MTMRKLLLTIWQFIADKLRHNDMTTHDLIQIEVTRRQNMLIREIQSSNTMIDLLYCRACIKSYLKDQFEWSYIETSLMILNSHLNWRIREIEGFNPNRDIINESEFNY